MGRARLWPERSTEILSASSRQPHVPACLVRPSITPFPAGCTLWVPLAWLPSPKHLPHIREVHPFVTPLPWLCRCLWPHAMLRGRKRQWLWYSLQENADSPHPEVARNTQKSLSVICCRWGNVGNRRNSSPACHGFETSWPCTKLLNTAN